MISSILLYTPVYAAEDNVIAVPKADNYEFEAFNGSVVFGEAEVTDKLNLTNEASYNTDDVSIQLSHAVSDVSPQSYGYDYVARLQIFAWDGDGSGSSGGWYSGHAFIVVTNLIDRYINAGMFAIAPGKGVTIGTWQKTGEHQGIWFGLEGYKYENGDDDYDGSYSMAVMLSQSALDKVGSIIKDSDKWSYTENCSTFATNVWNAVCSDKLDPGSPDTPRNVKNSIASYGTKYYGVNAEIPTYYSPHYGVPHKKALFSHTKSKL